MHNQGLGQMGLFEDLPDNLLDDVIKSVVNPKRRRR